MSVTKQRITLGDSLRLLADHYGELKPPPADGPFEMILWEQVAYLADDAKRRAAFEALKKRFGTDPNKLANASKQDLMAVTKLGGMVPEERAERILWSAAYACGIDDLLSKKVLMKFPMIGEPGAEKILLFCGKLDVLPLDSNGLRVLIRLGLVKERKSYSTTYREARATTLEMLPRDNRTLQSAYLLLQTHGRELCFRTGPECGACPLRDVTCRWR